MMNPAVCIREATSAADLVAVLKLRWEIYTAAYGEGHVFDRVSHYDLCARHIGVHRGDELVGVMRLVFRCEQAPAEVIRRLDAPFEPPCDAPATKVLPSEEAFDLRGALGGAYHRLTAEAGRFCIRADHRHAGLYGIMAQTFMALNDVMDVPLVVYSCGEDIAAAYTRYTGARVVVAEGRAGGVPSERFPFPRRTVAIVCEPRKPPPAFADAITRAAEQFRTTGRVEWTAQEAAASLVA